MLPPDNVHDSGEEVFEKGVYPLGQSKVQDPEQLVYNDGPMVQ